MSSDACASNFESAIQRAGPKNKELLAILSQTEQAVSSPNADPEYIADLKAQLKYTTNKVQELRKKTEDKRREYRYHRDSSAPRFVYKLGGKGYEEKHAQSLEKSEQELLHAENEERDAQERQNELQHALGQTERETAMLESHKRKHDQAQRDLDALYDSIFAGPTPEVPGEDAEEMVLLRARIWYLECQNRVNGERSAFNALSTASPMLKEALQSTRYAQQTNDLATFGVAGPLGRQDESNALTSARVKVMQARTFLEEAKKMQSEVSDIAITIPLDMWADLNIFDHWEMRGKIALAVQQLTTVCEQIERMRSEQEISYKDAVSQMKVAENDMNIAKRSLQDFRATVLERLDGKMDMDSASVKYDQGPPPAYHSGI